MHKREGAEIDRSLLELSPDNRVLRIQTTTADGSDGVRTSLETMRRIDPGSGLEGHWRSAAAGANVTSRFRLSDAFGGRWRLDDPDARQAYVFRPHGEEVAV